MDKIMICPKCGSRDVVPDIPLKTFRESALTNSFKCNNCGYRGQSFIEFDVEKFKKMKK